MTGLPPYTQCLSLSAVKHELLFFLICSPTITRKELVTPFSIENIPPMSA